MPERSQPLRVLLVISRLGTGGAEWQLVHLAIGLAERGHHVTLCAIHRVNDRHREPLAGAGVELVVLGADTRGERARAMPRIARLARAADVVHCTNWDSSLWGRLAALAARRPVVVADHTTDRTTHASRTGARRGSLVALHHRLLGRWTHTTVACARVQLGILESEGVPAERTTYIPNGIPLAEVRAAAARGADREDLGLPPEAPLVMHVAKFRPEKNQSGTLDIVSALREEVPGTRLVFVGHGPQLEPVRQKAAAMGADWAAFLGDREDVPRLLSLADLIVLPSRAETMPMVLLEAMATGTPVVAFAVGDVGPLLEDTGAGVAVAPGDAEGFVRAAREVLSEPQERARLAAAAARSAERYDATTMIASYERLLLAARRN